MRPAILLGCLGVALAAPLLPRPLLSASHSHELLVGLSNARLGVLPPSRQAPANPLIFPLQQWPPIPGLSRSSLGHFGGLVPNEIPFPGQVKLAQRSPAVQQEPPQLQMLQQNQQDPYQMVPFYPVCTYGPQDLPIQFSPQVGPPLPQEQIPSYPEFGCLTQQAGPVLPGGQQERTFDPLRGDAPETPAMPVENVLPYAQREMVNLGNPYAGIFMPSYPLKHQTANILASPTDNVIPLELIEEKINPDLLAEP
ncbi:odontogenic ameloblast-associated protein [Gracilinanus agilis]|uniref:odontogenic ameloblast-associated protein n=1 Tax=Gracilinanus agilis TaxID=191870 RepID=UPI001CFCC252|nr:odontogenic ameloblast-associated protein [Gracilinanus agilis]